MTSTNMMSVPTALCDDNIRVVRPTVTQQPDNVSCGLFLLEYAEQFLTKHVRLLEWGPDMEYLHNTLHVLHEETSVTSHESLRFQCPSSSTSGGSWLQDARHALKELVLSGKYNF